MLLLLLLAWSLLLLVVLPLLLVLLLLAVLLLPFSCCCCCYCWHCRYCCQWCCHCCWFYSCWQYCCCLSRVVVVVTVGIAVTAVSGVAIDVCGQGPKDLVITWVVLDPVNLLMGCTFVPHFWFKSGCRPAVLALLLLSSSSSSRERERKMTRPMAKVPKPKVCRQLERWNLLLLQLLTRNFGLFALAISQKVFAVRCTVSRTNGD